jgi:tetratricopeptide (TPR) repeat protein
MRRRWLQTIALVLGLSVIYLRGVGQGPPTGPRGQQSNHTEGSPEDVRLAHEAQEAMQAGNYSKAIEDLEKLVKDAPGIAEIHTNLASVYYTVGRFDDSIRQAREALKLKPSLGNAHEILGLSLAESGDCKEALPYLAQDYRRALNPPMKRTIGTDAVRCNLNLDQAEKAVELLSSLNREFPNDPDLLYLSSHVYSDLSTRASQRLLNTAPESYQAHQLNAEVLELQGKNSEAADEYRKVLSIRPDLPGIHYQLGELLLAGATGTETQDQARLEFEDELKTDPRNALAEYELGEMARQARQWNDAIAHFERSSKLDPGLADALIGLGKSLVSAGRTQDAVPPLERAVHLEPDNPNAHYQLSFAYRRLGREEDAAKELAVYRETHERLQSTKLRIRKGIQGNLAQPQTDTPPE